MPVAAVDPNRGVDGDQGTHAVRLDLERPLFALGQPGYDETSIGAATTPAILPEASRICTGVSNGGGCHLNVLATATGIPTPDE
jgi:hypothetical protein